MDNRDTDIRFRFEHSFTPPGFGFMIAFWFYQFPFPCLDLTVGKLSLSIGWF